MGRIRTVKPELFKHEELYDLEVQTGLPIRIAFIGLFTCCDRDGRFKWRPRAIKLDVLPYDDVDFSRVLHALSTRGFVQKYTVDREDYGLIPTFLRHQVINNREAVSEIPAPEENSFVSTAYDDGGADAHACGTRAARVDHAASGEGKGREGKGREVEGKGSRVKSHASPDSIDRPDGVDAQTWWDWLKLRKAKKAPVTVTVIEQAQREAAKAGLTMQRFLEVWCARGSQGLQADWLKPSERAGGAAPAESYAERTERMHRDRAAEFMGRQADNGGADIIDVTPHIKRLEG